MRVRPTRKEPDEAIPEAPLSADLIAAFRAARDRLRDALRGPDEAAAVAALRAFALASMRAGFTRLTARASVQVVVEEVVRTTAPSRARALNVARWMRRFDTSYDGLG